MSVHFSAGGAASSFTFTDGANPQLVSDGDTVTFAAGGDLTVLTSATDTVTYSFTEAVTSLTYNGATGNLDYLDEGGVTTNVDIISSTAGNVLTFDANGLFVPSAAAASFTLQTDVGNHTISSGDTMTIAGDTGITTTASGVDTLDISYAFPQLVALSDALDTANDRLIIYNPSALAHEYITVDDLPVAPETLTALAYNGATGQLDYTDETPTVNNIDIISSTAGNVLTFDANGLFVPTPVTASFMIGADSGVDETVVSGDSITFTGGEGISTVVGATDTITVGLGVNTLLTLTDALDLTNDTIPIFNFSAGMHETVSVTDIAPVLTVTTDGNATGVTSGGTLLAPTVDIVLLGVDTAGNDLSVDTNGGLYFAEALTALSYNGVTGNLDYVDEAGATSNVDIVSSTAGNALTFDVNGLYVPAAAAAAFTLAGDAGAETINSGDTMTVAGGVGLASIVTATDTVTLDLAVDTLAPISEAIDATNDELVIYNVSAGVHERFNIDDIPGLGVETTTSLAYNGATGQLDYTDETLTTNNVVVISSSAGNALTFDVNGLFVPALSGTGGTTSFTLSADTGSELINTGDSVSVVGGTGLVTDINAANILNIDYDFTELPLLSDTLDDVNDRVPIYNTSSGTHEYVSPSGLFTETNTSLVWLPSFANLVYTNEAASSVAIPLLSATAGNILTSDAGGLFVPAYPVTSLSYNGTTGNLDYLDEDGTTNNVDIISATANNGLGFDATGLYASNWANNNLSMTADRTHLINDNRETKSAQNGTIVSVYEHEAGRIVLSSEDTATTAVTLSVRHNGGANVPFIDMDGGGSPWELRLDASAGTAGQILTSNGAGAAPTWGNAPSNTLTSLAYNGVTGQLDYVDELAATNNVTLISSTAGNALTFDVNGLFVPTAATASFTLSGDTGAQTVNSGDTMVIAGGNGLSTAVAGVDTATINLAFTELTALTDAIDTINDRIAIYNNSTAAHEFVSVGDIAPALTVTTDTNATGVTSGGTLLAPTVDIRLLGLDTAGNDLSIDTNGGLYFSEAVTTLGYNGTTGNLDYVDEAGATTNVDIISSTGGNVLTFDANGLFVPTPTAASFTLAGDSGSETLNSGDTITVSGGNGLVTIAAATDTVTINYDFPELTALTDAVDTANDRMIIYNASAADHEFATVDDITPTLTVTTDGDATGVTAGGTTIAPTLDIALLGTDADNQLTTDSNGGLYFNVCTAMGPTTSTISNPTHVWGIDGTGACGWVVVTDCP